jgi:CRISPR-associated endonuclease/helicase Cas3
MRGMPTDYWGKFKNSPSGDLKDSSWLPLLFHLLDVATTFRELLDNGYAKAIAAICMVEELTEAQKQRLCLLAFLHDIGKAINDFQGQVFSDYGIRQHSGHTRVACSLFTEGYVRKLLELLPEGFEEWFENGNDDGEELFTRMFLATVGHHGNPVDFDIQDSHTAEKELGTVRWSGWKYTDADRLFADMVTIMRSTWPKAFEQDAPLRVGSAFMYEFNGLLTLADWMASDDRYFRFDAGSNWKERREFAIATAGAMLEKAGRKAPPRNLEFPDVFGFHPNAMQSALIAASGSLYH